MAKAITNMRGKREIIGSHQPEVSARIRVSMAYVHYFLAAVREGTFTRAAKVCGVRQPTLSLALMELESALGGALFIRRNSGVELTALGRAVRPHMKAIARSSLRVGETARAFAHTKQQKRMELSAFMATGGESAGLV